MLTVGDFVLNTDSRKLFCRDNTEVALAPTLFTLLKYFVDHQNEVLTKDMIIRNVWKGKIVVEANINQNIKKLRDVLGDSASAPKYIETVTGEGFRFIANSEEYKAVPVDTDLRTSKLIYVIGFLVLFIGIASFYLGNQDKKEVGIKQLFPVTTLKGVESHPIMSSDKKYLLFNHKNEGSWDIYVKPWNKEAYFPLAASTENELFPSLSPDQTQLIYFLKNKTRCGLFIRSVNLEESISEEPIELISCSNLDGRIRGEWINGDEIFISVNENLDSAASIFRYNLLTKQQVLVSKPESKGFGDYILKYSAKFNKLAYVRNIGLSSSEIWVFDIESKTHRLVKSIAFLLIEIEWGEEGELLFQSSNKEVSRINSDGSKEQVIARFLSNVYAPFSIDSKSLGVVVGDFFVIDISEFDLNSRQKKLLISSSFNDYSATRGSEFLAFLSTRSGESQVWIKNDEGSSSQLTHFNESFEVKWLSVSSNKDLIMFNKSGSIEIIDRTGKVIFNSANYSNRVHNNPVFSEFDNSFIYSVQYDGEWSIESRSLDNPGDKRVLFQGVSARPCIVDDCIFYFKQNDPHIYKYFPRNNTSIQLADIGYHPTVDDWDVYDRDSIIFFGKVEQENQIAILNFKTGIKSIVHELDARTFSYDRINKKIYSNLVSQGSTEVMYLHY